MGEIRTESELRLHEELRQCRLELAQLRVEQERWAEELSTVKEQRAKARARGDRLAAQVERMKGRGSRWRRLPRRVKRVLRGGGDGRS
ncbi:hypothetical protein KV102_04520 [Mumia sp. zg.B53]|uniref:hypothetical protein n=1 Tax=Mumia sp. zg.B53 TaxID=2855449 RepID=UPI001C6EC354|nr:hypothetical protein [Mumia sp. zg.B53]MBW9214098.1 hypothetical protein [Mumia sp. zg.B53]